MKTFKRLALLFVFVFALSVNANSVKKELSSDLLTMESCIDSDKTQKMSNISMKVNLTQLKHVKRTLKGESGDVECLIIPIKENDLFVGEKNISINLSAFKIKEKKTDSKATHIVKQQLSKELYDLLSTEEKRSLPILGDAVYWGFVEPSPAGSTTVNESSGFADSEPDDLPF